MIGPINLANPEKKSITPTVTYNNGVSMGNRGFWEGGSSNMITIAKKYLANPGKTSLIRKKVAYSEKLEYDENRKKRR